MKTSKATSYKDLMAQLQSNPHHQKTKLTRQPLQLKKQNHNFSQKSSQSHEQSINNWQRNITSYSNEKQQGVNDSLSRDSPFVKDKKQITHAYNKFITQITCILVDIIKTKPPQLLIQKLSYIEYLQVMKDLCLIHNTYQPRNNDLVGQLWADVISQQNIIGNFILVIASILKVNRYDDENQNNQQLFRKYANLRYTRMELKGKKMKTQIQSEFPFRPMLTDRTRTLASSHSRSKGKSKTKKYCFHQNSQNNSSLFTNKKENSSINSNLNQENSMLGVKRSEILYTLAKQKSLQKKFDKTSNQIQFQKSSRELTFKPKIHPNIEKKQKKKCINGEQNSISRMIRGRVERQIKKIINDRGLPYNQKLVDKMRKQKYEAIMKEKKLFNCEENKGFIDLMAQSNHESVHMNSVDEAIETSVAIQSQKSIDLPLSDSKPKNTNKIILDIYVDQDRCQKLIIEQNESLQAAAAGFVKKNNLSQQMYEKLVRELQKAMKFQLTQIDENSFEEDTEEIDAR